jgi:hypothetical protein
MFNVIFFFPACPWAAKELNWYSIAYLHLEAVAPSCQDCMAFGPQTGLAGWEHDD